MEIHVTEPGAPEEPAEAPGWLDVAGLTREYPIGRSTVYEALASGALTATKVGRRTIIQRSAVEKWLAECPNWTREP